MEEAIGKYDNLPMQLKYSPCAIGPLVPGIVLPHFHDAIEIIFTTAGTATAICNGIEHQQTPGSIFFAAPNEVHYFTSRTPDTAGLVIDIEPSVLLGSAKQFSQSVPSARLWNDSQMESNLWQIVHFMMDNITCLDASTINLLSCSILSLFLNHVELESTIQSNDVISRIVNYCQEHYREHISLDILSAELGLSVSYISRFFSSRLKMSFSDYINGMRLSEAATLLNDSKLTISNISSITGFPSIRTFNNAFMKQYGMTPSQYRNMKKNARIEVVKNA